MPPNPRDGHRLVAGKVPLVGVRDVIADALRPEFHGQPHVRDELAGLVVERLTFFKLLAADVDTEQCSRDVHVSPHVGCILR